MVWLFAVNSSSLIRHGRRIVLWANGLILFVFKINRRWNFTQRLRHSPEVYGTEWSKFGLALLCEVCLPMIPLRAPYSVFYSS